MAEVKNNNQLATGASKAGGGWQESIDDYTTTTAGKYEQQEHAADDEGNNKEGKGGKIDSDGNEGVGQQREQGWQGPWRWQQGWCASKRTRAAKAMVTRVAGEQWQQGQWQRQCG